MARAEPQEDNLNMQVRNINTHGGEQPAGPAPAFTRGLPQAHRARQDRQLQLPNIMHENGRQGSELESEAASIEGMASTPGGHTDHESNSGDSIQLGVDSDTDIVPMGDGNEDSYGDDDISEHNVFVELLSDYIDDERAAGDDIVGRQEEYD